MADSLLLIGKSGALTARSALELTAQNIANASNANYARRTLGQAEVAATGGIGLSSASVLAGVRPDQVQRSNSAFLQSEMRRTASDLQRAEAELAGLSSAEAAVEGAGIYSSLVDLEASLSRLATDPLDNSLRAAVVESGRSVAQSFGMAVGGLDAAAEGLMLDAKAGAGQVNTIAEELARTNSAIAKTRPGSSNFAVLSDQRDALLRDMSAIVGIETALDASGRVTVSVDGQSLVSGADSLRLAVAERANGTLRVTIGGAKVALASGSLLGTGQAMKGIGTLRTSLDELATGLIETANEAQANGVDPEGNAGEPIFAGSGAGDISVALGSGAGLATAPDGSAQNSRDIGNLKALSEALSANGPAQSADALLFNLSNAISSRKVTRDALASIAETSRASLTAETGVDLDEEAVDLLRFQQAFQASGRVMEVASEIFDTLLGIR